MERNKKYANTPNLLTEMQKVIIAFNTLLERVELKS
jgi:hypothetical protein